MMNRNALGSVSKVHHICTDFVKITEWILYFRIESGFVKILATEFTYKPSSEILFILFFNGFI